MRYQVTVGDRTVEVRVDGAEVAVDGVRVGARLIDADDGTIRLELDGQRVRLRVARGAGRGSYTLGLAGWSLPVEALDDRSRAIRALSGAATRSAGPAPVAAPMPGLIVRVQVRPGDRVAAGQGLVVMEAMKMENELRASVAGVVRSVTVLPGQAVEKGMVLVTFEDGVGDGGTAGPVGGVSDGG